MCFALATIVMSALALEGLVNSLGERKLEKWSDFESSQLTGKLRIICKELDVEFIGGHQPWQHVGWLVKLRNQLAHAKPQIVKCDEEIGKDELEKLFSLSPASFEKAISVASVEKALSIVRGIRDIFLEKLDPVEDNAFFIPH